MRCPQCQFENIPGRERCIRCNSVLAAVDAALEVYPPRMPAWRKPFRDVLRWLRSHRVAGTGAASGRVRLGLARIGSDPLVGLVAGVIPGLPHLLARRFREVSLLVLAWFLLLAAGVCLYGSGVGYLLVGLAIGLHVWIALQFGLLETITELVERAVVIMVVVGVLTLVYWGVPRALLHGYAGAHTALTIPALNVQAGDYLIVRRMARAPERLPRGTLVLVHPSRFRNERRDLFDDERTEMVGQVVGLPGEAINIRDHTYVVGEEVLDPARFPVPGWLQGASWRVDVPTDSYFISSSYQVTGHGRRLTAEAIRSVSVFTAEDIRGQAVLRWWPLSRRGFLE